MSWRGAFVSAVVGLAMVGGTVPWTGEARADGWWGPRGHSAFEHRPDWRDRPPARPSPYWGWLDRSNTWPQPQPQYHQPRAPRLSWDERRHLQAIDQEIEALVRRSFADGRLGRYERERLAELRDRRDRLALAYLQDDRRRW